MFVEIKPPPGTIKLQAHLTKSWWEKKESKFDIWSGEQQN